MIGSRSFAAMLAAASAIVAVMTIALKVSDSAPSARGSERNSAPRAQRTSGRPHADVASYPLSAEGLVHLVLAALLVSAATSLVYVTAKLSSRIVLHEIALTAEGSGWGLTVAFSLFVFAVLPLLGYVARDIPAIRTLLVARVEPIVSARSGS